MKAQSYPEHIASTGSESLLQVRLFGGLTLTWGDASLPRIAGRFAHSLLAYLITYRHRAHTRDLLAGTFWPDLPDAQARRRLSQALWQIRRVLSPLPSPVPFILTDADTMQFNVEAPYWLDVAEFERLVHWETGKLVALREAVDLYRGDFMAGFYDDWTVIERERLREMVLAALGRLLELCKARGVYEEALRYAQRLAAEDPLREEGHREVMRLCHLLGRNNEALQQYELCRAVLAEELGAEPTATTTALYREITARVEEVEVPYLPLAPGLLPSPLLEGTGQVPLVGRQRERATLIGYLEQAVTGQGGMVLVEGEAGVGKTRLLQEVGRDAQWRGAQVLWCRGRELVELPPYGVLSEALRAGLSPLRAEQLAQLVEGVWLREVSLILPELAEWLPDLPPRVALGPEQDRMRLLEALTRTVLALGQITPHVVILEDLQWADEATLEALINLTRRLAESRVLVIGSCRGEEARERAAVWEALQALDRAGYRERLELSRLTDEEAGELVRQGLGLTEKAPLFEARLYRETEGNPLFVLETLRALYDEGLLYRDPSGEWTTPWDETTTDYAELPLPPEVYQVIARRLARLGPDERATLNTAAVLGADFDFTLLFRAGNLEQEASLAAVSELVRRRLLEEEPAAYHFSHDKVRQVAYQEMTETERRRLHRQAGEALEALRPEQIESLAHHFTQAQVWGKAVDYNRRAGDRARAVYAGTEAIGYYDRALEAWEHLRVPDDALSLSLYQARGEICQETGRFDQAEEDFRALHRLATTSGDVAEQARVLNRLSLLQYQRGDPIRASKYAQQALELAQAAGLPSETASSLLNQANALLRQGHYQQAIQLFEQAAALCEELDDRASVASCLNQTGAALVCLGSYSEARAAIERALAIRRQLDVKISLCYSLNDLGVIHWYEGQLALAKRAFQEALDISIVVGNPWSQDQLLCNIGVVTLEQGFPTQAIPLFERALRIAREIGDSSTEAITLSDLGRTYYYLGNLERAQEILEQALSMMAASGERWQMPYTHAYLAWAFLATNEDDKALTHACTGLQVAQEIEDSRFLGLTHRVMAEVAAHVGSERAATEPGFHFEESIRILQEIGAKAELARSLAAYGLYLMDSADASEAQRGAALVNEARTLFRQMGMAWDLAQLEAKTVARLQPGQVRVRLPVATAPTGRPLRDDEWVEITWTVAAPKDEPIVSKVVRRQQRLQRLLREAKEQGAAPTVDDLGDALGVSRATIKRDLAALRRAGHEVRTRGSRNR